MKPDSETVRKTWIAKMLETNKQIVECVVTL